MRTYTEPLAYRAARSNAALRDVTPQFDRLGNVVIDVSYVVRERGTDREVGIFSTLVEAQEHADTLGFDTATRRETIVQTLEEYRESEFCRIHDC